MLLIKPKEGLEFEIVIQYQNFITAGEFTNITTIVDAEIWYFLKKVKSGIAELAEIAARKRELLNLEDLKLLEQYWGIVHYPANRGPSVLCIKEINQGSILITGLLSGAALQYCYSRFVKGFKKSDCGEQIEDLGEVTGDSFGYLIRTVNKSLSFFLERAKENGTNIKSVEMRKKKEK